MCLLSKKDCESKVDRHRRQGRLHSRRIKVQQSFVVCCYCCFSLSVESYNISNFTRTRYYLRHSVISTSGFGPAHANATQVSQSLLFVVIVVRCCLLFVVGLIFFCLFVFSSLCLARIVVVQDGTLALNNGGKNTRRLKYVTLLIQLHCSIGDGGGAGHG